MDIVVFFVFAFVFTNEYSSNIYHPQACHSRNFSSARSSHFCSLLESGLAHCATSHREKHMNRTELSVSAETLEASPCCVNRQVGNDSPNTPEDFPQRLPASADS